MIISLYSHFSFITVHLYLVIRQEATTRYFCHTNHITTKFTIGVKVCKIVLHLSLNFSFTRATVTTYILFVCFSSFLLHLTGSKYIS